MEFIRPCSTLAMPLFPNIMRPNIGLAQNEAVDAGNVVKPVTRRESLGHNRDDGCAAVRSS